MADFKIKKWSGSAWVDAHPETTVGQIVATGTPSSTTFLRGDGAWASVDSGNQYVNISGDTMTGVLTLTNDLNITNEKTILMSGDYYINKKFDMLENASPQYILLCASAANNEVMGTIHIDRSSSNWQAAMLEVVVTARSNDAVQGAALRTLQVLQSGERYEIVTLTYSGTQYIAVKYSGNVYPETTARFTGRMKSTGSAALLTTVGSSDVSSVNEFDGTTYSFLDVDTMHFRGNVGIGTDSPAAKLDVNGALYLKGRVFGDSDGTNTYLKSGTSGKIYFETNGGTRGGIDASGNFGIGTLSPSSKLTINSGDLLMNAVGTNTAPGTDGMKLSGYGLMGNRGAIYITNANASGDISFHIGNVHGSGDNLMRLDGSTSRVGIGTASPAQKLDVSGSIKASDNIYIGSNAVATQSYVDLEIAQLVASAPSTLDTLNELAAALGDDANFSTTVTNSIATKLPLAGGTMSGSIAMANNNITGINEIQINDPGEGIRFMQGSSGAMDLKIIDDGNDNILNYSGSGATFQVNGNTVLTEVTGAKRVDLTSQVQLTSYRKSVIALCNLDNSVVSRNSWSGGTIFFHRTNGLQAPVTLQITMEKRYNVQGANYTALVMSGNSFGDNIQYVQFDYNGTPYGGIEFKFSDAEHGQVYFIGESNFDIFGLDYYRTDTSAVLNSEVNNSISTSNMTAETDFFINNQKIFHEGNDGSTSGLDAQYLQGIPVGSFVRSDASDTMSGDYRIESGSFASLILDRGTTGSGSVVQFENNNGIIGGIGAYGDDGLQFRTTDGTQMVIDASNNVGIGTTSPSEKLEVNGAGIFDGNASSRVLYLRGNGNIVQFQGASNQNVWEVVGREANFYIYNNDLSKYSLFIDDGTNNIGINGQGSPAHALDVIGNVKASNDMYAARYYDLNNTSYYIDSGSTSVMNAVQFQTLQSNKTSYGEPNSENFYRLKIQNQGGTHNDVGLGQTASGNLGYNVTAANAHIFFEGTNGEIARLQPSGLALNHSGTGTVESKSITFTSQTADVDVVRVLKTTSGGNLDFNAGAVSLNGNGNITAKGNLYLNNDNTNTDTFVYFGDSGSDTDHYVSFDTSEQKFNFSNDILVNGSAIGGGTLDTTSIEIASASNTTVDISGFSSSSAIVILRARQFGIATATYVGKLSDISTSSLYKQELHKGSTLFCKYYRSSTQIIFSNFASSVSVDCYEMEVS